MNCIEALEQRIKEYEPCWVDSLIIEFKELPEEEKYNFDW